METDRTGAHILGLKPQFPPRTEGKEQEKVANMFVTCSDPFSLLHVEYVESCWIPCSEKVLLSAEMLNMLLSVEMLIFWMFWPIRLLELKGQLSPQAHSIQHIQHFCRKKQKKLFLLKCWIPSMLWKHASFVEYIERVWAHWAPWIKGTFRPAGPLHSAYATCQQKKKKITEKVIPVETLNLLSHVGSYVLKNCFFLQMLNMLNVLGAMVPPWSGNGGLWARKHSTYSTWQQKETLFQNIRSNMIQHIQHFWEFHEKETHFMQQCLLFFRSQRTQKACILIISLVPKAMAGHI